MDILNFHRKVIEGIDALLFEQRETNHLLRALLKQGAPQYKLSVGFKPADLVKENLPMSTTPTPPTDNTTVGQLTVGFPAETVTNPNTGVSGVYSFIPADIQWTIADPTIASFTVDATTGNATFTALNAGSTTGTVTDPDTKATDTFDVVVAPSVLPNTFAITVTFASAPAAAAEA